MGKEVLLTGATGFIAKHIAVRLLNAGHSVRGSVRSLDRAAEVTAAVTPHLDDPAAAERLRFVPLDLLADSGWQEALDGADALIHTASPFPMQQPRDRDEVVRPAVEGTRRALGAAQAAGVRRVVLTSSAAAITNAPLPEGRGTYDETDWTDLDHPTVTPYVASKTLAERAAWEMVEREAPELALTVINPVFVLGPPLDRHYGTSVRTVERLLRGTDPMLPRFGFSVVDVRDIAEMHVRALERPESAGLRLPGATRFLWFHEMAEILKAAHPERKIVTRQAPNAVVRLLALFDRSIRTITPILGRRDELSAARAETVLGMEFRDAADSVRATADWLIERGIV